MCTYEFTFIQQKLDKHGYHTLFTGSVLSFQWCSQVVETAGRPPSNFFAGMLEEGAESLNGTADKSRVRLLLPAKVKCV